MDSIPARPGSPLPSTGNRITRLTPARTPPPARSSGSRSRPPLKSRQSSMDVTAMPPPRGAGRGLLKPSKSSADLPALLSSAPLPMQSTHATESAALLAAFPAPPPLRRRTTEPPTARRSTSPLLRERPQAHQATRVTVPTVPSTRSSFSTYRVAEIEEAVVASAPPPEVCPALPFDLVPCRKIHLRRSPPSSPPRAFREIRPSPLKRAWSAEDFVDRDEDYMHAQDGWFMKVLMNSVREDEDEDDWTESIRDSTFSIQELPSDCNSDNYEEDPFHFDRNVGSFRRV